MTRTSNCTLKINLEKLLEAPFIPDNEIAVISLIFSSLVGVLFGSVPARKAAIPDPIDALSHE
jgi:putative ABC transport system permease protein